MTSSDIATAIVATARTYEADPIRALTDRRYGARKCLAPAIYALRSEHKGSLDGLCRLLGLNRRQVQRVYRKGSPDFLTAFVEARRALQGRV